MLVSFVVVLTSERNPYASDISGAMWMGTLVSGFLHGLSGPGGSGVWGNSSTELWQPTLPGPLPVTARFITWTTVQAAADANPGTEAKPWKTLTRAGTAKELRPETPCSSSPRLPREMSVTVSGERASRSLSRRGRGEGGHKGSEIITTEWQKVTPEPNVKNRIPTVPDVGRSSSARNLHRSTTDKASARFTR